MTLARASMFGLGLLLLGTACAAGSPIKNPLRRPEPRLRVTAPTVPGPGVALGSEQGPTAHVEPAPPSFPGGVLPDPEPRNGSIEAGLASPNGDGVVLVLPPAPPPAPAESAPSTQVPVTVAAAPQSQPAVDADAPATDVLQPAVHVESQAQASSTVVQPSATTAKEAVPATSNDVANQAADEVGAPLPAGETTATGGAASEPFGPSDKEVDRAAQAAIAEKLSQFYANMSTRNWDQFSSHFWPDARVITFSPGSRGEAPRVVMERLEEFLASARVQPQSARPMQVRGSAPDIWVAGERAHVRSPFVMSYLDGQESEIWHGLDSMIFLHSDGQWKIMTLVLDVQ